MVIPMSYAIGIDLGGSSIKIVAVSPEGGTLKQTNTNFDAEIKMDWAATFLIELLATPIVLILLSPLIKGSEDVTFKALRVGWRLPIIWWAAIIQMLGLLAVNLGLTKVPDSAPVVIAISACYPVLTIFLALRHLQERIPLVPLLGGVVGVAGVVILSLG